MIQVTEKGYPLEQRMRTYGTRAICGTQPIISGTAWIQVLNRNIVKLPKIHELKLAEFVWVCLFVVGV